MDKDALKSLRLITESDWNASLWFAVLSLLIGMVLAYLTLFFFY
jgi:hypothetical protein